MADLHACRSTGYVVAFAARHIHACRQAEAIGPQRQRIGDGAMDVHGWMRRFVSGTGPPLPAKGADITPVHASLQAPLVGNGRRDDANVGVDESRAMRVGMRG